MGSEPDPLQPASIAGRVEKRRDRRRDVVAAGTLACPDCDAPVAPVGSMGITAPLQCPFCARTGPVRDFLSLGTPSRAAHVVVRLGRSVAPSIRRA